MDKQNRRAIVAGNWKMNKTRAEAEVLVGELLPLLDRADCEVVLCTPFTDLAAAAALLEGSEVKLGAQNCHWAESGAFTGEISAAMLKEIGVAYVIVGHSERRQYFGETDQTVNGRLKAVLAAGMKVILCVGETLEQREATETTAVIHRQLTGGLEGVSLEELARVVIAYEPVWAIGTGKTATADQAGEVCAFVRGLVGGLYGMDAAAAMQVQYGGSMNAQNAAELLEQYDIDGGLIGGAALKAADFAAIVAAASR